MSIKIKGSLSTRDLDAVPEIDKDLKRIAETVSIGKIAGSVSGYKKIPSRFDAEMLQTVFSGTFIAQKTNGEITQSPKCYLPAALSDMIVTQCDMSDAAIEFAVDVILDPSSMNPAGYSYSFKSLMEIQEIETPIARLLEYLAE